MKANMYVASLVKLLSLSKDAQARNMYAQVIDDVTGKTICALSTLGPDFKKTGKTGATVEGAAELGKLIGKKAQKKGVTEVVFDRGGNLYHGRIQAVADGAREAGLKF